MSPSAVCLVLSAVAALVAIATLSYWIASRKRIAAETVGRAEDHAKQLIDQGQQIFRFDTGGWGTVTYWNAIVAVNELHGVGTFFDERLDDAAQFPMPPPPRRATSPRIRRMIRSPASSLRCTSISWRCRPCSRAPEQTSIRRRPLAVTRCSAARPIATMVS